MFRLALSRPVLRVGFRTPLSRNAHRTRSTLVRPENAPRVRYLLMVVAALWAFLYFVSGRVEKTLKRSLFTEKEFEEYERESGLKRRHRLIPSTMNNKYRFYLFPYAKSETAAVNALATSTRETKVINPEELVRREIEEGGKYLFLLQELSEQNSDFPRGLLTALVKQEVELYVNTTKGQYDTDFVLFNYPRTPEEAIKFENDISEVESCLIPESFESGVTSNDARNIKNIVGYFDVLHKVKFVEG